MVGNPLRIRDKPLPKAEVEAEFVAKLLRKVGLEVHALMRQGTTKAEVQSKIEGAKWGHFGCHGDLDRDTLMLAEKEKASSSGKKHTFKPKKGKKKKRVHSFPPPPKSRASLPRSGGTARGCGRGGGGGGSELRGRRCAGARVSSEADLTMEEVQRSMRMGTGSTVVLSACNSGRGKIIAEGVVGLARGFFFAGAAATVVSLWSVHDGSTAALMEQMYKHLEDGGTTAQALRLAMLHLLDGPAESGRDSRWRWPLYWAAFLVVCANTRLPCV